MVKDIKNISVIRESNTVNSYNVFSQKNDVIANNAIAALQMLQKQSASAGIDKTSLEEINRAIHQARQMI